MGFSVNRSCSIDGFSVFAFVISAMYPYQGKVAAAAGSVAQFGMLSLSSEESLPSHTATSLPGDPASAQANTLEFAGALLTLNGAVGPVCAVQLQLAL